MFSGREKLEHERRAVHHLAPAVLVGAAADPGAPEVDGFLEGLGRVVGPRAGEGSSAVTTSSTNQADWSAPSVNSATAAPSTSCMGTDDRSRSASSPGPERPTKRISLSLRRSDGVRRARVIESRIAAHGETHLAADGLRATDEIVRDAGVLDRHEVRHLGHAAVGQEPRQQHVGVGQVQLLVHRIVELRRDLEPAAAIGVEERGKHGRRVERREAEEVDRAVLADQRDGVEVADDAVVFDGRVAVWQHRTCPEMLARSNDDSQRNWSS